MTSFGALTLRDLRDREISIQFLASTLRRGELALLLGAGVSANIGLPNWDALVTGCETDVGLTSPAGRSPQQLMQAIDKVRRQLDELDDGRTLLDVVRSNLYSKPDLERSDYSQGVMQVPLLIALGAIVMASARGSVSDVFTMNFDDLLEWYLHLHGFRTQVVTEFPTYLRGDVDVTVFHPHGFVPLVEDKYAASDWLVLSHQQLLDRLSASGDEPWPALLRSRFLSKRFLAVGSSMNDIDIGIHLRRALVAHGGRGPLGFVLLVGAEQDQCDTLLENGMVPVVLDDYADIPKYILEVCQRAALDRDN
jgi:hypothetical protein